MLDQKVTLEKEVIEKGYIYHYTCPKCKEHRSYVTQLLLCKGNILRMCECDIHLYIENIYDYKDYKNAPPYYCNPYIEFENKEYLVLYLYNERYEDKIGKAIINVIYKDYKDYCGNRKGNFFLNFLEYKICELDVKIFAFSEIPKEFIN